MSTPANPSVAMVFGTVTSPQGDIIDCKVHLGCSKEVGSFELMLQNWDGKYSSGGTSPVTVGMDGTISVGRGAACPLLMTCRVENINCKSTPSEHYILVSGRCWGERLFRRVVTKTYASQKGEAIVKDLLDYYAGLSHTRSGTETVEATDTTYTKLEYTDSPAWDILKYVAETADKSGMVGFDFRVAPDGNFEFFPKLSKPNSTVLTEQIDQFSEYSKDITRIRNKITINGIADKSIPADKDSWTEGTLTPADGTWTAAAGIVSVSFGAQKGTFCMKLHAGNLEFGTVVFTLNPEHLVNCELYPILHFLLNMDKAYDGNVLVNLYDSSSRLASKRLTVATGEWRTTEIAVGTANASSWDSVQASFDWFQIWRIFVTCFFPSAGPGDMGSDFYIDGMYFGGRRYSAIREDAASQAAYGLREFSETDEELWSDNECDLRAKALLAYLKDPAEYLTLKSTVIDYGNSPILAGDKVHVVLPNENVNSDFRVESIEYHVLTEDEQILELTIELGKEPPQLADYLYGTRTFTVNVEKLARTKLGKHGIPMPSQSGGIGSHSVSHERGDNTGTQWPEPLAQNGGWDPTTGWIGPSHIGPWADAAGNVWFRTKSKDGATIIDHVFGPTDNKHGILGDSTHHWKESHVQIRLAPDDGFFRVRRVGDAENMAELGKEHLKFGPGDLTALDTHLKRIAPGFFEIYRGFGPAYDEPSTVLFRTKNVAGNLPVDHVFGPTDTLHGLLGSSDYTWYGAFVKYYTSPPGGRYRIWNNADANPMMEILQDRLSFGSGGNTALDAYIKRIDAGVFEFYNQFLPNVNGAGKLGSSDKRIGDIFVVNLDATNFVLSSLTIGTFLVITTDRILQNVTTDAATITSGQFGLSRLPRGTAGCVLEAAGASFDPIYADPNGRYSPAGHEHAAGDVTSGVLAEARIPNVFTGQITFQGGIITNSVNCTNWNLADAIFANGFRITEAENFGYDKGLAFQDNTGHVLMVLTIDGDLHLAGKIHHGFPNQPKRERKKP